MSIYATHLSIDDDDEELSAPIIYQGSHVNPAEDHPRGGSIDVAAIPDHCHPDVRGTDDDGSPVPYLRLSVDEHPDTADHADHLGYAEVILDRQQVAALHDTLTHWLEAH